MGSRSYFVKHKIMEQETIFDVKTLSLALLNQIRVESWQTGVAMMVRRIFSLFYAKIMVFGDGQFYRGFGGYWVFWFLGCLSECSCQFGTDLALVE